MKKQDIQIGGVYALRSRTAMRGDTIPRGCRKVKVIEFDWTEPEPEGERSAYGYSWRRTHTGTRVEYLDSPPKSPYGPTPERVRKGSHIAIPNRLLWGPWDRYVEERAEEDVHEAYGSTYREAKRDQYVAEEEAFARFLRECGLEDRSYDFGIGYRDPSAESWIALLQALGATEAHEPSIRFERAIEIAEQKRSETMRKAIEERERKLTDLGVAYDRADYDDEEREWLGLPIEEEVIA